MTEEQVRKAELYAEQNLSRGLLAHTRGCVQVAREFALRFGVSMEKAAVASYLHDIAKTISHDKQAALAKEMGMSAKEIRSYPPAVLHGPLGALIARKELGIDDPDVLQAIAAHSSGCRNMCGVAKVVFVADYIEHTRTFAGSANLRARKYANLDEATVSVLQHKMQYLLTEKAVIDPRALECWNELVGRPR